jgi:transposase
MRPRGSQSLLEERRRLSIGLLRRGLSLDEVSRRVGCHASSVFRWREAYRQNGKIGLKARPIKGRPPKLVARDLGRLVHLLSEGPRVHGYRTDLWTTARIAKMIRRQFGVRYHRDHIGRLMASLNWTYRKPTDGQAHERPIEGMRDGPTEDPRSLRLAQGWVPLCRGSQSRRNKGP